MLILKLKSIEEEAAECRKRFAGVKVGSLVVHCHHQRPLEILIESAESRISYILSSKDVSEQALRLRLFAPAIIPAKFEEAYAKWLEAYAKRQEAYANWREADAKCREASAKRQETDAKWDEWQEAYDKLQEADDKWKEAVNVKTIPHSGVCPLGEECPWNGETIFAGEFAN